MAQLGRAGTDQDILVSEHGRRFGIVGDGGAGNPSALILDNKVVASNRVASCAGVFVLAAAGSNGVGSVTLTGLQPGDTLISATDLSASPPADATSSFEATISAANAIKQTSASNLSTHGILFAVQLRS
jgi:hypothetical protein